MTGYTEEQWTALKTKAEEIGAEHGKSAATWYEIPDAATAQKILTGIDDGDPEILDTFADPPTGEFAGDYTFKDLYRDLGIGEDDDSDDMALHNAYLDAWNTAYVSEIERACNKLIN